MRYFGRGVRVRRVGDEEWTGGTLTLESENSRSLLVLLHGPVSAGNGQILNVLPLTYDGKNYTGVMIPDQYELEDRTGDS